MTEYDLENLKCDKIKEKTDIAQAYLKKNMEIRGLGPGIDPGCHFNEFVLDRCNNKIFFTDWEKMDKTYRPDKINGENLSNIFKALAEKVKENEELFSQLDFMIRNNPIDESKNHILLIVHQLLYWTLELSKNWASSTIMHYGCGVLIMNDSIPLCNLGCVVSMLIEREHVIIQTTKETAALCYLFTQLCHDVGLQLHLTLACVEEYRHCDNLTYLDFNKVGGARSGCTGVVLARCDLDSAVDTFIASSVKTPWKIQRILVQESIFELFKKTLELKCSRHGTDSEWKSDVRGACAGVLECGEKVFVLGGGGGEDAGPEGGEGAEEGKGAATCHTVHVEAFRTVEELLTLVPEGEPFYLSVWASNICEANEIASEADANFVWLNQYANFTGIPNISQALYGKLCQHTTSVYVDEEFDRLREKWLDDENSRPRATVHAALEGAVAGAVAGAGACAGRLRDALVRAERKCFVEFEAGGVCAGAARAGAVLGRPDVGADDNYFHNAMISVVLGNCLLYSETATMEGEVLELIKTLHDANVPISSYAETPTDTKKIKVELVDTIIFFQTKVIWTIYKTLSIY